MKNEKIIEWVLRIALAGEFFGHGVFSIQLKQRFLEMLEAMTGITGTAAATIMKTIGFVDIGVAILALLKPLRIILIYASVWAFLTALARPIAGDPIWDFVERWANVGIPLSLLLLRGLPKNLRELFS